MLQGIQLSSVSAAIQENVPQKTLASMGRRFIIAFAVIGILAAIAAIAYKVLQQRTRAPEVPPQDPEAGAPQVPQAPQATVGMMLEELEQLEAERERVRAEIDACKATINAQEDENQILKGKIKALQKHAEKEKQVLLEHRSRGNFGGWGQQ